MPNVFWNHSGKTIFITFEWEADPLGGPAIPTKTVSIPPGKGIDLDSTPLKPEEPKKREPAP